MHKERYYRGGADVKNYIRPYYREATTLGQGTTVLLLEGSGTTVGTRGTTTPPRGTTADAYGTTIFLGAVLPQPTTAARQGRQEKRRKLQGKRRGQEGDVYVMIPPKPFRCIPPLNSMAFLLLKSTKKKRRKDAVFISLRGAPNRLVPSNEVSGILKAHD